MAVLIKIKISMAVLELVEFKLEIFKAVVHMDPDRKLTKTFIKLNLVVYTNV